MIGWSYEREQRKKWSAVILSTICIIAIVTGLHSAEIKVTPSNPIPVNSFATITLDGVPSDADVVWDVTPVPTRIEEDGGKLRISGPAGTTYKIVADYIDWNAKKRTRYRGEVTVAGTPVPPIPPVPVDQFTQDMITAYGREPADTRQQLSTVLASLYRNAADSTVKDESVKTNSDLFNIMKLAIDDLAKQGKWTKGGLPYMRAVIDSRLTGTEAKRGTMWSAGNIDRVLAEKEMRAVADAITAAAK